MHDPLAQRWGGAVCRCQTKIGGPPVGKLDQELNDLSHEAGRIRRCLRPTTEPQRQALLWRRCTADEIVEASAGYMRARRTGSCSSRRSGFNWSG